MPNAAAKKPFLLKSGNTFRIEIDGFFDGLGEVPA